MRLPRLRDLAMATTPWLPLPPYRTQKDLVGGCDSDPGVEEWIANESPCFPNAWKIGYARTIQFV